MLPFADLSEKKDQGYFSDGLAEELIDQLTKVTQLHVIARASSFSFKNKSDDIPTIARKLHVANILTGSVRKSGVRLRVTTELIEAASGRGIWSETYDQELQGRFAAYQIAEVYAWRRENNKAFERLERAYGQRDSGLNLVKVDRMLVSLHGDPRFRMFLRKMKLPA